MKAFDTLTDPTGKLKKNTWFGGLLTVALITVSVLIFAKEMGNYKAIEVTKNMFLDGSLNQEKVKVSLHINLFSSPCAITSLDIHDNLNHHTADVPLRKRKFDSRTNELKDFQKPAEPAAILADVLADLKEGVGCSLDGSFELDKVEGNFHISFHSDMQHYWTLKALHNEEFEKLNLSYDIKSLHFGKKDIPYELPALQKLANDLNLSQELFQNFVDFKPTRVDHFTAAFWMEIIPYQLVDHRTGFVYSSYQNSFNMKVKELVGREKEETVPNLEFNYKFAALSAQYSTYSNGYHHILATVLIFVGGIFVFFKLINRVAIEIFRTKLANEI